MSKDVDKLAELYLFKTTPRRALQELCIMAPPVRFKKGDKVRALVPKESGKIPAGSVVEIIKYDGPEDSTPYQAKFECDDGQTRNTWYTRAQVALVENLAIINRSPRSIPKSTSTCTRSSCPTTPASCPSRSRTTSTRAT